MGAEPWGSAQGALSSGTPLDVGSPLLAMSNMQLHIRLKKQFGQGCLEQFPAKQLMYLKPEQAHSRRVQLQRWMQKVGGQPLIVQGETFQTFLLNAQGEVQKGPEEDQQLEIFLVNGKSVKVDIVSTDQTDDVLETVREPAQPSCAARVLPSRLPRNSPHRHAPSVAVRSVSNADPLSPRCPPPCYCRPPP